MYRIFGKSKLVGTFNKKERYCVKNYLCEANKFLPTTTVEWLQSTLLSILEEYDNKDDFNAEEIYLFYHCLPNKALSFKGESFSVGQTSKEIITVFVGFNSDKSEKLPLFALDKSFKPQCFKNIRT